MLYTYGEGWWLSRGGHDGVGSSIRAVGTGVPPRAQGERLRRALHDTRTPPRAAQGAGKAGAKAKLRKKEAQAKKSAAKGFGAAT